MRNLRLLTALLSLLLLGLAAPAAQAVTAPTSSSGAAATTARPATVVKVTGAVARPGRLTRADLLALPQQTVTATYTAAGVRTTKTFTGPLLYDVLTAAGPKLDPANKNDSLAFAVRAHAKDGYVAVVSWGEIDPGFEAKPMLVSVTEDGADLTRPRLVVPGDARGGRYVSDLDGLRLVDLRE